MTYKETVQWMFQQLPMYQRQGKKAFKKNLTNILAFSSHLGNPQVKFNSVHVAGTNGKGSTSHIIASVLQQSGYRVGLYTSPHLKDFRERIKLNGQLISKQEVIDFIAENKDFLEEHCLSFFEMTVAMAFYFFAKKEVDIAVVEVGLGGRLDSTNIITPEVAAITNIGYDHTHILGQTLPEIASEKAGIIKQNTPIVIGELQEEILPIFKKIATDKNASLYIAEKEILESYTTDLKGNYQAKNIKTATQVIRILQKKYHKISDKSITLGLANVVKNTGLLGRWQLLRETPKVICDTAHNKEGLSYTMQQLSTEKFQKLHIVMGVVADKNLKEIWPLFPKEALYYFCKPNVPRGLDEHILCNEAIKRGLQGEVYASVQSAYQKALQEASDNDIIYIGGSTFVVAEVV